MDSSKFLELNEGMLHERHARMTKHYQRLAEINSKSWMIENNSPRAYNLRKKYKQYDPLDVMRDNNTIVTKLTSIKKR